MIPTLNPIWALPLVAGGLALAVWLASKLYVEKEIEVHKETSQHTEAESQAGLAN